MTVVKSTGSHFLCYEPLIELIIVQSLWHIIIWNRHIYTSQGLNQYPTVTNVHYVISKINCFLLTLYKLTFTFFLIFIFYIGTEELTNNTYPLELLNCTLGATNNSLTDLKNVMARSPALVYITLNFTDLDFETDTAYLNNTPNVVNPLVWALASKGKGTFLVSLTSNYLLTSLGTLSHGVQYVHLDIETEECDIFLNVSDTAKFEAIATSLLLWSDLPCQEKVADEKVANKNAPDTCKTFEVCQSFFYDDYSNKIPISTKYPLTTAAIMSGAYFTSLDYFYGKTYCWSISNGDLHKRELSATNSVMVIVASIVSILFVLYGPLLVQLLTQRNKPLRSRENNEVWLANDTDLPVGLKYLLFIWKGGSRVVTGIRFTLILIVICIASHWEGIVMYYVDDMYRARRASAFRYLINYTAYVTVICILYAMFAACFLIKLRGYLVDENFGEKIKEAYRKIYSRIFSACGLDGLVPKITSGKFQFVKHMKQVARAPFSRQLLYDNQDEKRPFVLKLFICIPRFFVYLLYGLPYIQICLNVYVIMVTSTQSNNSNIECCCCLILPLFVLGLMYMIIDILLNAMTSCAFVVIHTFAGLVLNFQHINPIIYISLSMIAYIFLEINSFYDKYFQLHKMILKTAREIDENHHSRTPTQFSAIKLELFWHVVDECQPVGFQVVLSVFTLLVIGSAIGIGFWILNTVDELEAVSDTVVFVYSVIIPLVIPLGRKIITSNSNQELLQFEIESNIQRSVQKYFQENDQAILTREPEELIPEADHPQEPNSNEINQRDRGLQEADERPRLPNPPNTVEPI